MSIELKHVIWLNSILIILNLLTILYVQVTKIVISVTNAFLQLKHYYDYFLPTTNIVMSTSCNILSFSNLLLQLPQSSTMKR